jgi:hypothetical protein
MIFHCNKLDENDRKQISMMILSYPFTLNRPHTTYIRFQNNDEVMLVDTKEGAHGFGQFPIPQKQLEKCTIVSNVTLNIKY